MVTTTTRPKVSVNALPNFVTHLPIKSPQSPESNETLERKQLKSILKRLSEDRLAQNVNAKAHRPSDMKRLMRAQTLEGYVARRTKFTKSVTFNNTLSSPPNSAILTEEPEDTAKVSPPHPPPRPAQNLYPISNAQEPSIAHDHTTLASHRTIAVTEVDQSTNRFNFPAIPCEADALTTTTETTAPLSPTPLCVDDPSRSLSFVSDDYGHKKIVKGIQFTSITRRLDCCVIVSCVHLN